MTLSIRTVAVWAAPECWWPVRVRQARPIVRGLRCVKATVWCT